MPHPLMTLSTSQSRGDPRTLTENRFDRGEALKLYTIGSSWFSTEDWEKGAIAPGQHADLAILSADYFSIPEEEIKLKPNTYVSLRTTAAHGRSLSVSFSSSA